MNFNSLLFIGYAPLAILLYYAVPKAMKTFYLLVISLVFYSFFGPAMLAGLIAVWAWTALSAQVIHRTRQNWVSVLGIGVLAAVAILIAWVAFLGIRALYRATSGNPAPQPETATEPAVTEAPSPQPAELAKTAKKDAKPEEPATASAPRTPQNIPSIYID